jgi:hypothetical protein
MAGTNSRVRGGRLPYNSPRVKFLTLSESIKCWEIDLLLYHLQVLDRPFCSSASGKRMLRYLGKSITLGHRPHVLYDWDQDSGVGRTDVVWRQA